MIKLFVGGFSPNTNELQLVQIVSTYATVSTIKIVRDKISKKSKGYAFIEVDNEDQADRVIDELDGTRFEGRILTFNKVQEEIKKTSNYNRPKTNIRSK